MLASLLGGLELVVVVEGAYGGGGAWSEAFLPWTEHRKHEKKKRQQNVPGKWLGRVISIVESIRLGDEESRGAKGHSSAALPFTYPG